VSSEIPGFVFIQNSLRTNSLQSWWYVYTFTPLFPNNCNYTYCWINSKAHTFL